MLTDYNAKYIAHELTRCYASDRVEKLTAVLSDARVALKPERVVCLDEGNNQLKANAAQTFEAKGITSVKTV